MFIFERQGIAEECDRVRVVTCGWSCSRSLSDNSHLPIHSTRFPSPATTLPLRRPTHNMSSSNQSFGASSSKDTLDRAPDAVRHDQEDSAALYDRYLEMERSFGVDIENVAGPSVSLSLVAAVQLQQRLTVIRPAVE